MVERVLEVDGLVRTYGPVRALDGMTFSVQPGSVTGFLGPNGAGKTTTMRAIFGLVALDAGEVRWNGRPIDHVARRRFGYLPEERGLYPSMKVLEQLRYLGQLRGLPRDVAATEATRWLASRGPGRPRRRRAGGPLARQSAARPADRRADPPTRCPRARRAVLRSRPGGRRRPLQGPRRRGQTGRDGALLVAPARSRRGPVRTGDRRRPRPGGRRRLDRRADRRRGSRPGDPRPGRSRGRSGQPSWTATST